MRGKGDEEVEEVVSSIYVGGGGTSDGRFL